MTVQINQTYRDLDPRYSGRTLKVIGIDAAEGKARVEVLTNASDVQALLDDETPGTRGYQPKDRRGKTTTVSVARLEGGKHYGLMAEPPQMTGPMG
jgi:hypothetical protein